MPDYGHDLAFGTFITPQNQRPDEVRWSRSRSAPSAPGSIS
jgi:hypothetical protein